MHLIANISMAIFLQNFHGLVSADFGSQPVEKQHLRRWLKPWALICRGFSSMEECKWFLPGMALEIIWPRFSTAKCYHYYCYFNHERFSLPFFVNFFQPCNSVSVFQQFLDFFAISCRTEERSSPVWIKPHIQYVGVCLSRWSRMIGKLLKTRLPPRLLHFC